MAYLRRYDRVLLAWRRSCVELTGLRLGCLVAASWLRCGGVAAVV